MGNDFIYIILGIPIAFFFGTLGFQMIKLLYLWLKLKSQNLKELKLWD